LVAYLSAGDNMRLTQVLARTRDEAFLRRLAGALGISALLNRMPATLSGGERQRVAVGRALAHRPRLLLADEPTAAVHPSLADRVLLLLQEAAQEAGAAVVLTTHDAPRAVRAGLRESACVVSETQSVTEISLP